MARNVVRDNNKKAGGFTIVELLVVLVIIGILSTVAVVSYQGVKARANDVSVQSDIDALDGIEANYGLKNNVAGKAWYSGSGADSDLNFTPSSGNVIDVVITSKDYCIRGYNTASTKNSINNVYTKESSSGVCNLLPPSAAALNIPTVIIAGRTWMKYNMNVGTMVNGGISQAPGQKWCYSNLENNCTGYGALYEWKTAMNGDTGVGARGICYTGFHIPTETELFGALSSTSYSNLLVGGSSGFDMKLGGDYFLMSTTHDFEYKDLEVWFWSSSLSGGDFPGMPIFYGFNQTPDLTAFQDNPTGSGASVRCIKN